MGVQNMATPHLLSFRIADDAGNSANVNVFLDPLLAVADIQTFVDSFAAALDAVTAGVIQTASVSLALSLPGTLKGTPLIDHPVQTGALIGYTAEGTVYRWSQFIPAIRQTLVTAGALDTSAGALGTLVTDMVNGITGVEPVDRYNNDLTGDLGAELRFRKA
jgi:hypothetical protein